MRKLKIGLIGLMQKNFRGNKVGIYNKSVIELDELSKKFDFELFALGNGVITPDDALAAKKEMEDRGVDFLLIQNSSFASGYLIQTLAHTNAYIGLWAVPEPTGEGPMLLNSFCGMNLNAGIIGEYLKEYNIPFKWFYGNVQDNMFIDRFMVTLRALNAVINIKGAKIALVGGIAPGFDNFYYDERLLEKRFGVKVDRHFDFDEIKSRALSYKETDISDIVQKVKTEASSIAPLAEEAMEKNARVIKAYMDISDESGYSAIASTCWPRFRSELGMVPCAAFGRLNDQGLVTACEGDVYSALSMLVLKYAAKYPPILMDLSDIDEKNESVLLWHCGVGSKYYAHDEKIDLEEHFNPGPYVEGEGWMTMAPVASMRFRAIEATIMRFSKEGSKMFLASGKFDPDRKGHDGSRGWFGNLKLKGEDISVRDLINTIMVNRYHHHYPLVKGILTDEMIEFAAWLEIEPLEKIRYADFMQTGR